MLGIFLDIETTGLDAAKHYPVDIAFKVFHLTSGECKATYRSVVRLSWERWETRDPNSMLYNGYTWEDVSQGKEPAEIGKEIVALLTSLKVKRGNAVFICQNPAFDRGFFNQLVAVYEQEKLNWPYHWLDLASMFWTKFFSQQLPEGQSWPETMSISKNDIAQYYHLPIECSPHRAMTGVNHLVLCYEAVLNMNFNKGLT